MLCFHVDAEREHKSNPPPPPGVEGRAHFFGQREGPEKRGQPTGDAHAWQGQGMHARRAGFILFVTHRPPSLLITAFDTRSSSNRGPNIVYPCLCMPTTTSYREQHGLRKEESPSTARMYPASVHVFAKELLVHNKTKLLCLISPAVPYTHLARARFTAGRPSRDAPPASALNAALAASYWSLLSSACVHAPTRKSMGALKHFDQREPEEPW